MSSFRLSLACKKSKPSKFGDEERSMEMVIPAMSIDLSRMSLFYNLRMSLNLTLSGMDKLV